MSGLTLSELVIHRGAERLVALDRSIAPGEVLTVMGPSGAGKSTLLAAIIGTLAPAFRCDGRVLLDGRSLDGLPPSARHIGILFQDDVLFPHLSVGGNLAFGLASSVRGRRARRLAIEDTLTEAGLGGLADRDPATLSGGQRARAALMRMLLAEPRALLLDEPFSRLDAHRREQIRDFVFTRARERALPTLLVTHDPGDALAAGGDVISPLGAPVSL